VCVIFEMVKESVRSRLKVLDLNVNIWAIIWACFTDEFVRGWCTAGARHSTAAVPGLEGSDESTSQHGASAACEVNHAV